ncbi:MAG TPA: preprotein translocase subunit SecE [Desulfotomaculum sp.]|nr:preprotein translocase subunit SecE [Desulfotomaculum sp.]
MGSQVKKGNSVKRTATKSGLGLKKQEAGSKKAPAKSDRKQLAPKKERVNYLEEGKKYFKAVYNELKKVHWPGRREVAIYTGVVLVAVAVVGVLIWVFDSLLSRLLQLILK